MSSQSPHVEGTASSAAPSPVRGKDPLQSFRGVLAGTLVIEAIAVALAMLVVIKFNGGVGSAAGIAVIVLVAGLVVTCCLLRHRFALLLGFCIQLAMIACVALSVPLGVIGVVFALVWAGLMWMRHDVAKRMAAGTLPAQQPQPESE